MSNGLGPDQTQHFVEPDLGPNCLRRISEKVIPRHYCPLADKELNLTMLKLDLPCCENRVDLDL